MHANIARVPGVSAASTHRTSGITRLVYRSIQGTVGLVGHGLDMRSRGSRPCSGGEVKWPGREPLLAALNGVLGDYLEASDNPLGDHDEPAREAASVAGHA